MLTFDAFVQYFIPYNVLFDRILGRMTTPQEVTQTLWRFIETKSIMQTNRNCSRVYQKYSPLRKIILQLKMKFVEAGRALKRRVPDVLSQVISSVLGRHSHIVLGDLWNQRQEPHVPLSDMPWYMPDSTGQKILRKILRVNSYKIEIVQVLESNDRPKRMDLIIDMHRNIEYDAEFLNCIMFFYEDCFRLSST